MMPDTNSRRSTSPGRLLGAGLLAGSLLFGLPPDALAAQERGTPAEEEAAVRAVIAQVFRGMSEADSAMVRATFDAGARFASATRDGGIRYAAVDDWLGAVASSEGKWDERVYDITIRMDGPIASAWVPYTFYLDGQLSHCGVNTIELLRTAAGWKITQLSDSRRQEDCPDPRGADN